MPTKRLVQIESWSFSRFKDYRTCPALAKFKHLDKLKEPHNLAMGRGLDIHEIAEQYVLMGAPEIPRELKLFTEEFNVLRAIKNIVVEQEWAFTKDWKMCEWKDWLRAWLRIKVDCFHQIRKRGTVIDYKTGKVRTENKQQLELYAIGGFLVFPDLTEMDAQLWYLDEGELNNQVFKRKELKDLQAKWVDLTRAMLTDTMFSPNPNPHCQYCHFRNSNNGPCEIG